LCFPGAVRAIAAEHTSRAPSCTGKRRHIGLRPVMQ
jgi:hypothetical protein